MQNQNSVLIELWADLQRPNMLWQIATLAACLILAAVASHGLRRWLRARAEPAHSAVLQTGVDGLRMLLFPLLAWLFVLVGRAVLSNWQHVNILHVAVPLLFSLVLIRLVLYLIRRVFAPSGALANFEKVLALLIWVGVALHITGLADALLDWLEQMRFPLGKHKISLLLILQGALAMALTLVVTLWVSAMLEARLLRSNSLEPNLRLVLTRVLRALLVLVGVVLSLSVVGFDLTALSVFGGALGVGLGLGLQKIASNYVSGFVILLDRSLRIDDLIEVDKYRGQISEIKTRYTVLRATDGTEAIVPNEMLLANPVLNHSYSNKQVRLFVRVCVSYDTHIEALMPQMIHLALAHPRVLKTPAPSVALLEFTSDGILLELGFWVEDPEQGTINVRSDLNREILKMFRASGIEIPYPQREIRILDNPPLSKN